MISPNEVNFPAQAPENTERSFFASKGEVPQVPDIIFRLHHRVPFCNQSLVHGLDATIGTLAILYDTVMTEMGVRCEIGPHRTKVAPLVARNKADIVRIMLREDHMPHSSQPRGDDISPAAIERVGHLFPAEQFGDLTLSVQAGTGYLSFPQTDLPNLADYQSVEIGIFAWGREERLDLATMGFPEEVANLFNPKLSAGVSGLIAGYVPQDKITLVRAALIGAAQSPNAGYPTGSVAWAGRTVYHGTSLAAAQEILSGGISPDFLEAGYFGRAFYVTDQESVARDNYALASEDGGAVLKMRITEAPGRVLDLRNAKDWECWANSGLQGALGNEEFRILALKNHHIAGVYDRSMEGLAIYDLQILEDIELMPDPDTRPSRAPNA